MRHEGFRVGVDHHLKLQELLRKAGKHVGPHDLKTILCPLIATSAPEQEKLYRIFDEYFTVLATPHEEYRQLRDFVPTSMTARAVEESSGRGKRWYIFAICAAVLFTTILVIWRSTLSHPKPLTRLPESTSARPNIAQPPVTAPPSGYEQRTPPQQDLPPTQHKKQVETPEQARPAPSWLQYYNDHRSAVNLGLVIIAFVIFLIYEYYRLSHRKLVLQQKHGKRLAHSRLITVSPVLPGVYGFPQFYSGVRRLQRRHASDFYRLDINATIQATVASIGFPRFRYKPDSRMPEYLALVDRSSFRDQQARLFEHLVDCLKKEGLFVDLYCFDGDPRVCSSPDGTGQCYLAELQRRHADRRFILFGNAERLIDPVSGRLVNWATLLLDWKDRAILTTVAASEWSIRERALAKQFIVLPASTESLFALAEHFDLSTTPETASMSRLSGRRPAAELETPGTIPELRNHLGNAAFSWLCACAIYPELHWDLTLHLGCLPCLGEQLISEGNLLQLIRLPWFRQGFIPDEMRSLLIRELDETQQKAVRATLVELLEKNLAPQESHAPDLRQLEIASNRYWRTRWPRKKYSEQFGALRDMARAVANPLPDLAGLAKARGQSAYTKPRSLEFLSESNLDFVLPKRLQMLLYGNDFRALGFRTAIRAVGAIVLVIVLFFTINNLQKILTHSAGKIAHQGSPQK